MKNLLLLLLVGLVGAAGANVFQLVGPNGEVYFSDQPIDGATPVEIGPVQTVRLPAAQPRVSETPAAPQAEQSTEGPVYAQFSIEKPEHDQGVRANDGSVTVYLELQPPLQPGHSIVLNVDGQDGESIRTGEALNFNLVELSRGRHTVAAKVVDAQGETLIETGPIGFYVLRVALGQRVTTQ